MGASLLASSPPLRSTASRLAAQALVPTLADARAAQLVCQAPHRLGLRPAQAAATDHAQVVGERAALARAEREWNSGVQQRWTMCQSCLADRSPSEAASQMRSAGQSVCVHSIRVHLRIVSTRYRAVRVPAVWAVA